jgi:hypothetical protein
MWPVIQYVDAQALQAETLFVSALQRSDEPSAG